MKFVTTWANRTRGHPATYQKKTWRMSFFFRKFDGSLRNVTSWFFLKCWEKPGVILLRSNHLYSIYLILEIWSPFFLVAPKNHHLIVSLQKSVVPTCTRMKKPLCFLAASSWSFKNSIFVGETKSKHSKHALGLGPRRFVDGFIARLFGRNWSSKMMIRCHSKIYV